MSPEPSTKANFVQNVKSLRNGERTRYQPKRRFMGGKFLLPQLLPQTESDLITTRRI